MPPDRCQKLKTFCEALRLAGRGGFQGLCDVLAQRFLAVERRALGQPELPRDLELVEGSRHGLASRSELQETGRSLLAELRLSNCRTALGAAQTRAHWAIC